MTIISTIVFLPRSLIKVARATEELSFSSIPSGNRLLIY